MTIFLVTSAVIIGYLLGAIPFGVIISKRLANRNPLEVGSGKTGMTNVLRTAGKKAAALALICDIAKGAFAVTIADAILGAGYATAIGALPWRELAKVLAAAAAICGHNWSVFLRFRGGRGVATFMGTLLALYWPAGVLGGILVLSIGFRTRYMSLGSIIGAVSAFIMMMAFFILRINFLGPYPPFEYVVFGMAGAIFIYARHHDNIVRLFNGTERRIGEEGKGGSIPSHSQPK
ncbi:MAG: glycerol-3-phosphate 1-O-acyltransferase PlsY [Dehalococcoidales bacterium]|nr:glycerol-3-phosphate 1-O-acyltransferase PlsY [Dehalococcoidales bacterium]